MSSASAKRAKIQSPVRTKLRKSVAFWSVIAIGGLIPAIADAAPAAQPGTAPAAGQSASSDSGYLSSDQALSAIPDLQIAMTQIHSNQSAVLTGTVPAACASRIQIQSMVTQRNADSEQAGFVIQDKGGFIKCVNQQNSAGNGCSNPNTVCTSLSQVGQGSAIPLPGNDTVSVAYLNKINQDVSQGPGWTPVNLGGSPFVSYSAGQILDQQNAAAAKASAERQASVQQQFLHCAQSPDQANEVLSDIQNSGLTQDQIDKITKIAKATIDNQTCGKVKTLETGADQAIRNIKDGKASDSSDLEDQIYDLHGDLTDDNSQVKESLVCQDGKGKTINARLAQAVYNMALARATSDNARSSDIDAAEASLNRALDPDTGLNLSDKSRAVFEQALNVGIPENRFRLAFQACDQATDDYQVGEMEIQKASQTQMAYTNGYALMSAENSLNQTGNSATKACKAANSMYDKLAKELRNELKDNHCNASTSDSSSVSFDLFHDSSSSTKSHANGSVCDQLAQESKDLSDIENNVRLDDTQTVAENLGSSQLQTGLMGGLGGFGGQGGNSFGGNSFGIPQNTTFGAASPFGSPFGGGMTTFGGSPMTSMMPGYGYSSMPMMANTMMPGYGSQFSGLYFQQPNYGPTMGLGFI